MADFHAFLPSFKINFFFKNSFENTVRESNSLDPYQARHFVGPDLGPKCLQKLSVDGTCIQAESWGIK